MAGSSPFPIDPELTAIAIAYKNMDYIADEVAPRVSVSMQEFKFTRYADEDFFTIPDTLVGRRSKPNEIEFDGTEVTDSCLDFGLDGGIPNNDIINWQNSVNASKRPSPVNKRSELLTELVMLDREKRVADITFNLASYPVALRQTLAGTGQFSDFVNSDPLGIINAALDAPLLRPNQIVFGQSSWASFRAHPKVVKAVQGNNGDSGLATREQVAALFEVGQVLVGKGRANSNKPGQAPALYRLWGKHIALTYKAPVPDADGAPTHIASFQWGDRIAGQWEDKNIGLRGGQMVRVGESLKERVVADQAGYFIQNAVL